MISRLLLTLLLIAVTESGCMEKGPEGTGESPSEKSIDDLKALSIQSADDLNSYRFKKTSTENILIDEFAINVTPPRVRGLGNRVLQISWAAKNTAESTDTAADIDLSGHRAGITNTAKSTAQADGQPVETKTVRTYVYQVDPGPGHQQL